MFDNIRKNPMFRRFIRWFLFLTIVYFYTVAVNIMLKDYFDYISLNLILYVATIVITAILTILSWGKSKSRWMMCQKTDKELENKQPPLHHPRNEVHDYLYAELCTGCMVKSYYRDIKRKIEDIEECGSMDFYKNLEDE